MNKNKQVVASLKGALENGEVFEEKIYFFRGWSSTPGWKRGSGNTTQKCRIQCYANFLI